MMTYSIPLLRSSLAWRKGGRVFQILAFRRFIRIASAQSATRRTKPSAPNRPPTALPVVQKELEHCLEDGSEVDSRGLKDDPDETVATGVVNVADVVFS